MAGAGDRKLVLFSHHQPFSLLDVNQGPMLVKWLQPLLDAQKIFAWYWGHEHRSVLYDPHPGYGLRGRCVGHGGFPEARADLSAATPSDDLGSQWKKLAAGQNSPGALVLDTPNLYIPGFEQQFTPHGYMRLDFNDGRLSESVHAPGGDTIYSRDLV
ncbi:Metallophosphoesterase (fragment) [Candidatus Sulfopaludibacter sp. SbA4]